MKPENIERLAKGVINLMGVVVTTTLVNIIKDVFKKNKS